VNLTILLPGMPPMYSRRAYDMFFLTRKLLAFIVIVMLEGLGLKNVLEGWCGGLSDPPVFWG
jgi:hypothetical protein